MHRFRVLGYGPDIRTPSKPCTYRDRPRLPDRRSAREKGPSHLVPGGFRAPIILPPHCALYSTSAYCAHVAKPANSAIQQELLQAQTAAVARVARAQRQESCRRTGEARTIGHEAPTDQEIGPWNVLVDWD